MILCLCLFLSHSWVLKSINKRELFPIQNSSSSKLKKKVLTISFYSTGFSSEKIKTFDTLLYIPKKKNNFWHFNLGELLYVYVVLYLQLLWMKIYAFFEIIKGKCIASWRNGIVKSGVTSKRLQFTYFFHCTCIFVFINKQKERKNKKNLRNSFCYQSIFCHFFSKETSFSQKE